MAPSRRATSPTYGYPVAIAASGNSAVSPPRRCRTRLRGAAGTQPRPQPKRPGTDESPGSRRRRSAAAGRKYLPGTIRRYLLRLVRFFDLGIVGPRFEQQDTAPRSSERRDKTVNHWLRPSGTCLTRQQRCWQYKCQYLRPNASEPRAPVRAGCRCPLRVVHRGTGPADSGVGTRSSRGVRAASTRRNE